MKIFTFNLKKGYRHGIISLKILALIILSVLLAKFTSDLYINSSSYKAVISDVSEKATVILDAGHGGEDCGAIGSNGALEKDLNFEITMLLGEMLTNRGFAVIYTRTEDALLYTEEQNIYGIRKINDLKNRCKIGAEYPSAIYISIHMNSYKSPECTGLQVYYSENNKSSNKLASCIQNSVKEKLQSENKRQIKSGKGMYILENLNNTAVLIECGFLTNLKECEKLSQKEYQKELSFAIVCGIIEYTRIWKNT